jgi:hypothetical protein
MSEERGTLALNEPHPMAQDAYMYVASLRTQDLMTYLESYSSCAIEGNRTAEVCSETLRRVLAQEPVSDRYLLGLAWSLRTMEEPKNGK